MRLEGRRGCACSAKVDSGLRSEHAQIKDSWALILRGSLRSHLQRQRQSRCAGMTDLRYASAFPRRDGPEFYKTASPLLRIEGVGNAGCPMHPQPRVRYMRWHTSVVTTGPPDSPGIPARNGFNGLLRALPGERIRLVTVAAGLAAGRTRSGPISPPTTWHQQRVSEPHDLAVR